MDYSEHIPNGKTCSARELREDSALTLFTPDQLRPDSRKFHVGTGEAFGRWKANQMRTFVVAVMCVVSCSLFEVVSRADAQASPPTPPGLTYYSIQHAEDWPPLPANIWGWPEIDVGGGMIGLNDVGIDYDLLSKLMKASVGGGGLYTLEDEGPPEPPGEGEGGGGTNEVGGTYGWSYSTNDFWIELTNVTETVYDVVLHNTQYGYYYQVLGTTDLTSPITWTLEKEVASAYTGDTPVQSIPRHDRPILFLRAAGETGIGVSLYADAYEPDTGDSFPGQNGTFLITRSGRKDTNLTVYFKLGGAATYGVDYTNTVGTVDTNGMGSVVMSTPNSRHFW